jgi:hypothetical protein
LAGRFGESSLAPGIELLERGFDFGLDLALTFRRICPTEIPHLQQLNEVVEE